MRKQLKLFCPFSVSNYIVTTSLFDGWPKIDERMLVIWNTLLVSLFSAVTVDIIFLYSW